MKRLSYVGSIRLNAPPAVTLPLFTADGEGLWIEDWTPTYVYPASGEPERGLVWKIDGREPTEVWITVRYNLDEGVAEHIKVAADKHIAWVEVHCVAQGDSETIAHIRYTLTALNDEEATELGSFSAGDYEAMLADWEKAINHYLASRAILLHGS